MGNFLCVSAVRTEDFGRVLDAVTRYLRTFDVEVVASERTSKAVDIALFEPTDGWTTISWPAYFNTNDAAACRWLSADLGAVVSAMSIYDGDTWLHSLYRDGELVDRFARCPLAISGSRAELRAVTAAWTGDPVAVATTFGVPPEVVAPYYSHVQEADEWEFVELWERLGVTYPVSQELALPVWTSLDIGDDWQSRLPSEG